MTRYLLYSHDTYGLGHVRRSMLLAQGLVRADRDSEVLIVTGSPRAQVFRLPERVDMVKLPSATKDPHGRYRPRKLGGSIDALVSIRGELIASTVRGYRPDVVLVDHAPLGMLGELQPTLDLVDRMLDAPRMVLGLRDIIDAADRVDTSWHRDGVWRAIGAYDEVLVYGDPTVRTTATELGLEHRLVAPVTHVGYVAPAMPDPLPGPATVLVTTGGGGDGQSLIRKTFDAIEQGALDGLRTVIVTGPLMSASRRAEIVHRADALRSVEVIEFSNRMRSLISSAAAVISMAGYNTVVELLAAGVPALLVPRSTPRLEQHIRAERLAPVTALEHCPLERLDADRTHRFVTEAIQARRCPPAIDLNGIRSTATRLATSSVTTPSATTSSATTHRPFSEATS